MDLKQLAYFVQVAELGSFTRASSVLRMAQPALSRQVRLLEVELHQPLFDRDGRGVTLTPAGTRLLAHGRGILQQVQRARQDLEDERGAASGPAVYRSIGLPPSISRSFTAPMVDAFRSHFPKATISVVEGLSTYTLEWLAQGRVDCAVVYNATPAAAIDLLPVLQERLYLLSARSTAKTLVGRPLPLADVAQRELGTPARPHAIRMRLETVLAEAGLKPRVALEIESVPAILDLVQRRALHAVLSLNAVRGSGREPDFTARPVLLGTGPGTATGPGRLLATTLYIATSAQRPRGPLLEQAVALLARMLNERLAA